ncbi:MAG: DNA polymerase 1 [Candidatus Bathyarchaeota archaeon BA2]|nr:MAG: DNA polymerase 1 [Candidatus Bathyarchaeota archaeon BA2]
MPTFEAKLDSINLINEFGKLPPKLTNDVAVFIYDKLPIDQRKTQLRILRALATGEMKNIRQIARDAGLKARCVSKNLRLLEDRAYVKMAVKKPNLKIYQITSKGIENIPLEQILSTKLARKKGKHGYYYIWLKDLLPDKIDGFVASSWKIGLYGVGKSKYKVNAIIPFTNELSRLLGYYVSEGHSRFFKNKAGGTTYTVTITNYDDTILKDAEKCVMKAFNLKARRSKRGENLLINSKIVYLLFINVLNLGDKAEDKQVPHIIITGTTENKKAFLEAYYLGDGTARQNEIKLTSKSPTLINQLSLLLMQLNVKGIYLTQDRAVHRLRIRDTTPFVHQKIKRKGYACIVPNKYIADIARRLRKFPYVYKDGKNISRNRAIALLQEYTTKFENSEYVKRLMSFLEGNLGLDKIKEMRRVKCSSNYVYDISVDGAENFIGGYGLICLHNSYGVFGAEAFDLYCPPVAEATAAIGRHVITNTINKAQELGIDVIYGDTDSIFLRGHSQDQIKVLEGWSEKELGMELDVDKSYRYSVFSSRKKNYLGIFPDGSVDVKGMTGKKRHIPAFIKKAFDQMEERLGQVESPGEFEEAKREIRKIIRDRYMRLKQRKWGDRPDELAFHVVLGKVPGAYTKTTPQHVRAALILKDMGYELKAGDLISFVKVMKEPRVKPVQLASNSEIDVDKYVAYLHSTFDQVLDALGLDFDEIIGLTKLERFM